MKCKLYFKNPTQYFVLEGTKEEIVDNYINDNELTVISVKSYGRVCKLVVENGWGGIDTVKVKSFA